MIKKIKIITISLLLIVTSALTIYKTNANNNNVYNIIVEPDITNEYLLTRSDIPLLDGLDIESFITNTTNNKKNYNLNSGDTIILNIGIYLKNFYVKGYLDYDVGLHFLENIKLERIYYEIDGQDYAVIDYFTENKKYETVLGLIDNFIDATYTIDTLENLYNKGYEDGRNDYGHKENGTWYNAISWGNLQYSLGVTDSSDNPFINLIGGAFNGAGQLLNIELIPGIKIGMFLLIPLVFGILAFLLGKRK